MVSVDTLEVVMKAKDEISSKIENINKKLSSVSTVSNASMSKTAQAAQNVNLMFKRQEASINSVENRYTRLKNKVTSVFSGIKSVISNSTTVNAVKESNLSQPFLNAAEKIKQKWSSMTEYLKSKIKNLSSNNTKVDVGFNINNAGLMTLDGEIAGVNSKINILTRAFNLFGINGYNAAKKVDSGFNKLKTSISNAKSKITNLASGMSGLQGAIMGAFGAVGVSSMKSFIFDAALAREKVNAVTQAIVGSKAAAEPVYASIKKSVAGTTLGYNNMAKAVNTVGLRYHMTAKQLEQVPSAMSKVGLMAQAMGKSNEEAAKLMENAYDGLMGKWKTLKTLGITEEDLKKAGWSGAANDVEGYTKALDKVLERNPKLKEMTNSTEYKMESLKMSIKGVGTEIGLALLPIVKQVLDVLQDLSKNHPWLLKLVVTFGVLVATIASISAVVLPIIQVVEALKELEIIGTITGLFKDFNITMMLTKIRTVAVSAATKIWTAVTWLQSAAQTVLNFVMSMNPITIIIIAIIALIAVLVYLYYNCDQVREAFNNLYLFLEGSIKGAIDWVNGAIQNTITWFEELSNTIQTTVVTAWNDFCNSIQSAYEGFIAWITGLYEQLLSFISYVQSIPSMVIAAWNAFIAWITVLYLQIVTYLNSIIMSVYNWSISFVTNIINTAVEAVNGFLTYLANLLLGIITQFILIIARVVNWRNQVRNKFIEAATSAVNGFINYLKSLPTRLWSLLQQAINRVISFATDFANRVRNAAVNAVNNFINNFNIAQGVWNELVNIKNKIYQGVGMLVSAMRNLAQRMWDNFMATFNPFAGTGVSAGSGLMAGLGTSIDEKASELESKAKNLGKRIITGFNSNDYSKMNAELGTALNSNVPSATVTYESKEAREQNKLLTKIYETILDITSKDENESAIFEVINSGKLELKVTHDINGKLPDGVTADEVVEILKSKLDEKEILARITNNPDFQELDKRQKIKMIQEIKRFS